MHGYFNTPLHVLNSERVGNRHPKLRNYLRAPQTRPMGLGSDFSTPAAKVGVKQVCVAWCLLEVRHQLAVGHMGKTRLFFPLLRLPSEAAPVGPRLVQQETQLWVSGLRTFAPPS